MVAIKIEIGVIPGKHVSCKVCYCSCIIFDTYITYFYIHFDKILHKTVSVHGHHKLDKQLILRIVLLLRILRNCGATY